MKCRAPAAARNRDPIAAVLAEELPAAGLVLEIASGTGEHAAHFARAFPQLDWQPSDPDPDALISIAAWQADSGLANLRMPITLDAAAPVWPVGQADAVVCINMVHISEWEATTGLFRGCANILTPEAPVILYGPYLEGGVETAQSNLAFDRSLKDRNPAWGLRSLGAVDRVADNWGFRRTRRVPMPANNLALVYRRK
ncbi:DUF938 domain-containing protein [Erythrobacter arachoides]|uniref:DUF938 domain-containing protein n=1 Tax=Aurantiacibacter arachoides TaxID=1850444 RepID=A0A845A314_9SPHN|nr:DUF938 domain-containing protein [Aurantiacibacter arachoides]MXO93536.1 DUF938 domain-containing protein [Aurantiacibacter arachoides]GGD48593.1 SAM-dependent methyltransferase [Aurantiacibacter arachoides]